MKEFSLGDSTSDGKPMTVEETREDSQDLRRYAFQAFRLEVPR